jgi:multidrug efflux pump subunit AcrA (membrane-fusion protein)
VKKLAALAVLVACKTPPPANAQAEARTASSVETRWLTVAPATDLAILEAPAWTVAAPGGTALLTTAVRGRIEGVLARAGDHVHAGDALVVLRAPELVSAVAARSSAQKRIAAYEKHVKELASLRKEGLLRTTELFQVEAQLADIQAEKSAADAILLGAGLDERAATEVQRTGLWTLRAPITGVVRAIAAEIGGLAEPGGPPLVQLVGPQPARVEVHLQQALPTGVRVRFVPTTGAAIDLQDAATATAIDPQNGSQIRWFEPVTPIDLPGDLRGRLVVAALPDGAFQVPARALVQRPEGAAVVLQVGANAEFRHVEVLAVTGTSAIVRGLHKADVIAADADRSPLARPPEGGE